MRKAQEPADLPDDATLVARARADDKEAFAELVGRYERPLAGILLPFTHDANLARDIVQDTILRAWQNLHRYREEHRFATWFFRIGVNLAITRKRRESYELRLQDPGERRSPAFREGPETPLEAVLRNEDLGRLRTALGALPERYQNVLRLRYSEGMACQDIATMLGTTPNTVSIILFRAKQRLRELLEGPEGLP